MIFRSDRTAPKIGLLTYNNDEIRIKNIYNYVNKKIDLSVLVIQKMIFLKMKIIIMRIMRKKIF